jgi:hypothetical protein
MDGPRGFDWSFVEHRSGSPDWPRTAEAVTTGRCGASFTRVPMPRDH